MRFYILILIGTISFSSCFLSTWDARLVLVNKTSQRIKYYEEIKSVNDFIPDTTFCNSGDIYWIDANSEQVIRSQNKWDYLLKNRTDKILRIYIFNEDTILKYGLCKVFKNEMFIKRFDFTYEDLEKLKWRVIYDDNFAPLN